MSARIQRIEVRGVTRSFGATLALRGVDAVFKAGTVTTLEGPNGAGKSTLLAIIGTLMQPNAGTVEYAPLGQDRAAVRGQLGWLAHESGCYPELSGRANVALAARLHGAPPENVATALGRVGAVGFAGRAVATLSRGQRQRVALARALVHGPSLLLLDEPSSGLDPASVQRLEDIIREERAAGTLIIMVSHSMGLAERIADRRLRLVRGRIQRSES